MQQGQGPDIHALIVIGQVNTGKHTFYEQALSRSGISYDSYNMVKRAQIHLTELHPQIRHTTVSSGRKIKAVQVSFLHLF